MNRGYQAAFLCLLVLTIGIVSLHSALIYAPSLIAFRVEQVAWGTSTNAPIEVAPGDTNAPLTVDVRNLSNETLKGVYGVLQLEPNDPFTDYVAGGYNATATGVPLQAGDIFNQTGEILPAGSFAFTFRLNIARGATPGYYHYSLQTDYLVKYVNSTWLQGEPQTLEITILLPNRPPSIDAFTPSTAALTVQVGNSLNFTAKCSDPDNDTLTYEWKLDATLVSNVTAYIYAPTEQDVGSHTMVLTISDSRLTDTQTWTITVAAVSISHFWVSSNYLTAGFDNELDITIQNNLWKGIVQVELTVPQPLIIRGNQSWTFGSLAPSINLSIAPMIYAPATSIGSTFTATLTVNYDDEHALAYTETYNVGLIVQGYVKLVIYDVIVNPLPAARGSEITITATALNTGNVIANYANASFAPSAILELSRESSSYVGDVELNSPVPFTVVANVKPDAQNGTYPLTIALLYQDDQYRQHVSYVETNLVVATGSQPPQGTDGSGDLIWFLENGGWTIVVIACAGIALLILYLRRLPKTRQAQKSA